MRTSSAQATPKIPAFWQALAACETGGRWDWGRYHRKGEGHRYEGGVGFYAPTWTLWRRKVHVRFVHAWQAPPLVQIRVARYGLAHHGFWGCLAQHPSIYQLPGR